MATSNCQYSTRYCWDADKVKALIRLRAELSPLFTGKRNASKYAWAVVERELNVPLPLSKIIKKWNNLLQEYKAIKISEEPKRREWPFFTLMDVYFSDQVNDPSLRLFSSTKTLKESLDESVFEDDPIIVSAIAAVTSGACMEIEELLKRQKDRRANENKFAAESKFSPDNQFSSDKLLNSKAANYRISENKTNIVTVKNLNCMQQQVDSENNNKSPPEHHDLVKNEKIVSPKPILRQQQSSPTPTPAVQNKYSDPNSIDQYLLSWNNFLGNMSRGFHTLQKDEKMVDVTIAAGGKIFKAHKLVLSVCSPYFQKIFLENPSNHPILLMADVEANHMAGLLNFMYSGQVNVKYEDLPVFLKVAEAMKIKGLHTEKPEGQNLEEIQFSRDDTSADLQALNSSSMPINFMEQSTAASFTAEKERQCHTSFHPINRNKNLDIQQYNMNTLNFEQASNKFSILKTNGSKKLSEHLKQQKYLTKRKIFVHCENEFKEKRNIEISEKGSYNNSQLNLIHMTQRTLHGDNSQNEEILNLAQNGAPNAPKRFVSATPMEPKIDSTYNQTSLSEIPDEHHKDTYIGDKMPFYGPKSNEDGNNNTLNIEEVTFVPNNNNNNNVDASNNYTNNCYNPPRNPAVFSKSNVRTENDDNNNGSTDSNYDVKKNLIKQADNNNNVFLESPSNIDKDKDSSTVDTKIKPYSDLY